MTARPRLIALGLFSIFILGCAEKREPPPPLDLGQPAAGRATPVTPMPETPATAATAEEAGGPAAATHGGTPLPANLWPDVPIHKGAQVVQAVDKLDKGFTMIMTTDDALETVQTRAQDELASNGWTLDRTVVLDERAMITCSKDGQRLHMVITGGDETRITLVGTPTD